MKKYIFPSILLIIGLSLIVYGCSQIHRQTVKFDYPDTSAHKTGEILVPDYANADSLIVMDGKGLTAAIDSLLHSDGEGYRADIAFVDFKILKPDSLYNAIMED